MSNCRVVSYGLSIKGEDHKENEDTILVDDEIGLYAVADGVTIPYGGGPASRLAIKNLRSHFKDNLEHAVKQVNETILDEKKRNPTIGSTTLTVVYLANWRVRIAHVGDSLALVIRDARMVFQTAPQTRHGLLTNAIGEYFDEKMIDIKKIDPANYVILATDGITAVLSPDEILGIVLEERKPKRIVERTLGEVTRRPREYRDDRSMIVVQIPQTD